MCNKGVSYQKVVYSSYSSAPLMSQMADVIFVARCLDSRMVILLFIFVHSFYVRVGFLYLIKLGKMGRCLWMLWFYADQYQC